MQIPSFRVATINEYRDDLATALCRKADNTSLSDRSLSKLAYITNDRFGFGLGAVFTGPLGDAPVLTSYSCQLQIEKLRNVLIDQRLQLREGSCLDSHLRDVLDRLPQLPSCVNQREIRTAHRQKFSDGTNQPSEVRTSYEARSAAAQLTQFMEDGLRIGYTVRECTGLWNSAMNVAHLRSSAQTGVEETITRGLRKA